MARYVGWGALPGAFIEGDKDFSAVQRELKELLTEKEYSEARASTKNAHYTSPEVISGIYDALRRFGVEGGRALEPSAGVGNFLGLTPEGTHFKWSAIELDPITGGIAKQLYPEADVRVQGFERFKAPDGFFDVAVSNVPFGNYQLADPKYDKLKLSIHNYFFVKSLDLVRPGGVVAFVTSRYTLDSGDPKVRKLLADRANFLGAVRLPSSAFAKNAGTQVITDVLFFQKPLEGKPAAAASWTGTGEFAAESGTTKISQYYLDHPEMMLGEPGIGRGMHTDNEFMLKQREGADLASDLRKAIEKLPTGVYKPVQADAPGTRADELESFMPAPEHVKEGGFMVQDGTKLMQRIAGKLVPAKVAKANVGKVSALVGIKDAYREVLRTQLEDRSDKEITAARVELNRLYDLFVKKYGPISQEKRTEQLRPIKGSTEKKTIVITSYPNLRPFQEDPDWSLVSALEVYDAETNTVSKADALKRRTIDVRRFADTADTPTEALPVVLADRGRVELDRIAQMSGATIEDARAALKGLIFENPQGGDLEQAEKYLSGNVRAKLVLAKEAASRDPRFKENVEALEKVQPKDLPPSEIAAHLGSPWIPASDIERFVDELLGENGAKVQRFEREATWKVLAGGWQMNTTAATNTWGTRRANATKLIEDALNLRSTIVYDPDPMDPKKRVQNAQQTLLAQEKQMAIRERFERWVWEDAPRATRLARHYNDTMNNMRAPQYDGSHLTFPGAASHIAGREFALRPHQANAVWRIIQEGSTLLAHVVGSGKTFTIVAAAMEMKRMGLIRKPVVNVPNHMLGQWSREFRQLYPTANLLVATPEDFAKEGRKQFVAKAAAHDWDAIIITHSSFEKIAMSREFQEEHIRSEMDELAASISEAKKGKADRSIVKQIESAVARRKAKLERLAAEEKKDDLLTFEELGVDMMFVDEMHLFKNLEFTTKMRGVSAPASQRAYDLYLKSQYLNKLNPGRGLVGATGTPIANTVAEAYTMMRYFQPEDLQWRGLAHFDAWAANFGKNVTTLELDPTGNSYRMKERFSRFENMPELGQILRNRWDVQTAEMLNLPTPKLIGGKEENVVAPSNSLIREYVKRLGKRADDIRSKKVTPDEDNFLAITVDGRHAGLDMRLVDRHAPDLPNSKVNLAAERIHEIWKDTKAIRGTQLVFLDLSAPGSDPVRRGGVPGLSIYSDLKEKLVARGIPAKEIAFIHDPKTLKQKNDLFQAVRDGRIRVLLGSTEKMGAGTNVQTRLVAQHDLDAPWRPADMEQRHGRILRQGNMLYDSGKIDGVRILRYVTEGSFDAYMWQGIERKAGMIAQAMRADGTGARSIEDVDETALSAGEIKALASGNPLVMKKAGLDADVAKLERLRGGFINQQFEARQELANLPAKLDFQRKKVEALQADIAKREPTDKDNFKVSIDGKTFSKRPDAGEALRKAIQTMAAEVQESHGLRVREKRIGTFAGFELLLAPKPASISNVDMVLRGEMDHFRQVSTGDSPASLIAGLEHLPKGFETVLEDAVPRLASNERRQSELEKLLSKPWEQEAKLKEMKAEQASLNEQLKKQGEQSEAEEQGVRERPADSETEPPAESGSEGGPDGGSGGTTLYAISDPISLVAAMVKELKKARARAAFERRPLTPSSLPEVEERWQASKGITPPSLRQKVQHSIDEIRKGARHFEELDQSASPLNAQLHDILLEVEHAKDWATVVAHDTIGEAVEGLSVGEIDTFTRAIALQDILKDLDAGLYDAGNEIPFGYPDKASVETDLDKVEQAARSNPKIMRALKLRREFAGELTKKLVDLELLPKEVLEDERYYHRQVMEYHTALDRNNNAPGLSSRDVRVHRKGFQRQRKGGGDFNTSYQEAEFEWVSQAVRMIHMAEALKEIKKLADITGKLKAEAKVLNRQRYKDKTGLPPSKASIADIREVLGDDYVEWKELIPDDYREWQPEKGNYFYKGLTLSERALDDAMSGFAPLEQLVRHGVLLGGRRESWIVPEGLAATMDKFGTVREQGGVERAWTRMIGWWKQWQLLNPARLVKYNLNNVSGDFDAAVLYPRMMKFSPAAISDLEKWMLRSKADDALKAEMQELVKLRVIGNTLTMQEIPDINEMPAFRKLVEADPLSFMKLLSEYWRYARLLTQLRENILRLSAFRYFESEINAGRGARLFAASNPTAVRAIEDPKRRAALLSRDLIGDYGAISTTGQFLRSHLFPFFSWQEINARRYIRLFRNIVEEGGHAGRGWQWTRGAKVAGAASVRGGLSLAVRLASAAVLANAFFFLTNMWNQLMFPNEEHELRREGRANHIILGREKDGSIRTLRVEGAFADFLEWLNLNDYPADIKDVATGKETIGDKVKEAAEGPLNRVAQMWEPIAKTFIETLTRRALYPDVFHPRTIRDQGDYIANSVSLGWLYRKVTDKPIRPSTPVISLFSYTTDPGEAAYYQVRELAGKYMEEHGKGGSAIVPNERANALYYWKKAAEWGDEAQSERWLRKYYEMGGTSKGAKQSAKSGAPLAMMPHSLRGPFLRSLDPEERDAVKIAERWQADHQRREALNSLHHARSQVSAARAGQ